MKSQLLLNKYTLGLAGALKTESEYRAVAAELKEFARLSRANVELRDVLASPVLPGIKKLEIVVSVIAAASFRPKSSRFIFLLMEHGRLELLDEILDQLPVVWNEKRGIQTFEVSSVVPLTASQRTQLEEELERLEDTPVRVSYKIDPELIGGLTLKKGNLVYDASLKGNLRDLKEKISEG